MCIAAKDNLSWFRDDQHEVLNTLHQCVAGSWRHKHRNTVRSHVPGSTSPICGIPLPFCAKLHSRRLHAFVCVVQESHFVAPLLTSRCAFENWTTRGTFSFSRILIDPSHHDFASSEPFTVIETRVVPSELFTHICELKILISPYISRASHGSQLYVSFITTAVIIYRALMSCPSCSLILVFSGVPTITVIAFVRTARGSLLFCLNTCPIRQSLRWY